MSNLLAHKDTVYVPEAAVLAVPQPQFTASWRPYSHKAIIEALEIAVANMGLKIRERRYSMRQDGAKMFGVWIIRGANSEFQFAIGLRNSLNKAFSVGICAGKRVTVCDNLIMSAEFVVFRKHTARFNEDELYFVANRAVESMLPRFDELEKWHNKLHETELKPSQAALLTISAVRRGFIPAAKLDDFNSLYYDPRGKYTPTLHGWHGAATEVMRDLNLFLVQDRNAQLNNFIDYQVPCLLNEGEFGDVKKFNFVAVEAYAEARRKESERQKQKEAKEHNVAEHRAALQVRQQIVRGQFEKQIADMKAAHFKNEKSYTNAELKSWIKKLTTEMENIPKDMRNRYLRMTTLRAARMDAKRTLKTALKDIETLKKAKAGKGKAKPKKAAQAPPKAEKTATKKVIETYVPLKGTARRAKTFKCPECDGLLIGKPDVCIGCGHSFKREKARAQRLARTAAKKLEASTK